VANCALNFMTKVSKQSMESIGSFVNQFRATPFREVGNTRQKRASSAVYRLICVTYASMCLSDSVVPSYLSSAGLL